MSSVVNRFEITEDDLSFLTSEELSAEDYLWSQIELSAEVSKFELCEALIEVLFNKYIIYYDINGYNYRENQKKVSEFLLKCFKQNYENQNIWFIYQLIRRYKFDDSIDRRALQLDLLLRNHFDVSPKQTKDLQNVSKLRSCDPIDDKVIIVLKNLILSEPKVANLLIDLFEDKNSFNFIYSQSLIHALKNDNKTLVLNLLTVFPDQEIDRNVALLEEVCDQFSGDEENEFLLYKSVLLRRTPKLIQKISDIRRQKSQKVLYDCEKHRFDSKECFLLAANHKKHFIVELLDDEKVGFDLKPKQRLFFLIYGLHKSDLKVETFQRIERDIEKLVFDCEEIQNFCKTDPFIRSLVKRLRFVINFTKWCITRMDLKSNTNAIHSHLTIFRSVFLGDSPLKILFENGFLSNKNENNESLVEDISRLLSECDESELMIYRGFLAIRLTIMWVILSDTDSYEEQIAFLLKKIFPMTFRVEILENIFSLLFLTQNELIDNETDEEDDTEENNVSKDFGQTSATDFSLTSNIHSGTPYFLCPNSLVPQILSLLKDIIIDSQAALFAYNYKKTPEMPRIELNSSIKDLSECKIRLETLMKYVSEGQWRYDVIEPAFNKNILNQNKKKSESIDSSDENENEDILDEKEYSRSFSFQSSDNEKSLTNEIFSSLISCMLASPKQLMRYSLLEGQIERAKQVVKLFEHPLKNSKEVRELEIICKWRELTAKLRSMIAPQKSLNSSKMGEIAATGLNATQIQSLINEFVIDLDVSDRTKNSLVVDFALTTSPSIEISEIILNSILENQKNSECFSEKVNSLLIKIRSMICDLSKEYDNKSISFAQLLTQFVEKENFWDSKAFREQKTNEKQLKIHFEDLNKHLTQLESKDDFETSLSSPLKPSMDSIKNMKRTNVYFERLLRFCSDGKYQYLKVLFYYVRKVSRALNECRKNSHTSSFGFSDSSYFSILQQSPSAILCSMVLKDGISPKFVDDFAKEMKVDLIGTLCSVLCPKIPSHLQNDCSINEFVLTESCHPSLCEIIETHLRGVKYSNPDLESHMIQNHFEDDTDSQNQSFIDQRVRNIDLINYFYSRSPLLVEIMKILRLVKEELRIESDLKFKSNSPLQKWVEIIKSKFGSTPGVDQTSVLSLAFWPRIVSGNSIVIKTLEHYAIKGSLLEIYDLFQYIQIINTSNSSFISSDSSFKTLRNAILSRLALEQQDVKYALQIVDDPNTKCDVVIELIEVSNEFEVDFTAIRTLKCCLSSLSDESPAQDISALKTKLISKVNEIEFYSNIGHLTGLHSWKDAKHDLKGVDILTIIKTKKKYPMAVDWFKIQGWETDTSDLQFELLVLSYCQQNDLSSLTQLLLTSDTLEVNALSLIGKLLNLVLNFDLRLFLIEFILKHFKSQLNEEMIVFYNNYILGIKLIKGLDPKLQNNYINIISKPLLIVEQMLMNIEYEALEEAVKILNFDYLIESYAQKAVEIQIYDIPSAGTSVISDATLISSSFMETKSSTPKLFSMPEYIPTKDQWIPDSNVTHCMLCKFETFSMLNRRHHCRRCGRVVCGNCSQNNLLIREIKSNSSVRVCDECYIQTQTKFRKESINSEASSLSRPTDWVLSCDDLQNDSLRMEFYYDSSPSVSLCLTLLKLHSDKNRCCKLIVESICKPLLETVVSSQVDYGLVIGMIRSLLVSTRISLEDQKSELMDQLNHLLDRLDVIRMLINSNCNTKELISYALSTNDNSIFKLQEKLIEMERFELARDLAAKFGLDSKSIFKTSAFICLKHNQLSEARDKFRLVFDKNNSKEGNRNLENIINVLSKRKYWSNTSLRDDCLQIQKGKLSGNDSNSSKFYSDSNELQTKNPKIFNEVMYYLEEYGTNEDVIKFYVKNSLFKPAITLFLNNSNSYSNNFFMKELFLSSVKRGLLSKFLRDMKSCDPSLTRVWRYLITACKYLSANHMIHVLHVIQVFMGDNLRAAITQINWFFLSPKASDYMELYSRLDNLQTAKQHCTDFLSLNPIDYRSGCLIMEREEVLRQLRSLNIQIDITIRFHENRINGFLPNGVYSPNDSRELKTVPTILDHNKARKTELAALVAISYGQKIAEGFAVSQMIVKDHNLDSVQVYRLAGRALVQMPQINALDSIQQLLQCIRSSFSDDISLCDDVISASIRSCSDPSLVEPLIKLLSNDVNKFDAYILSGKLKSAYLLATNSDRGSNRETDILRVLEASKRRGDSQITKICELWLKKKSKQN